MEAARTATRRSGVWIRDAYAYAEFIQQVPGQVWPLEFTEVPVRRELRHDALGRAGERNLESKDRDIQLNGVMLLSQILNFDISNDDNPEFNPGMDLPYELALPTYAATAWYHHKLPGAATPLPALLSKVEQFALGDYAQALNAGTTLSDAQKQQVAQQLSQYTGVAASYWLKADLRVNGGEFEHQLLGPTDTTGRLDTRFAGPSMDPLAQEAEYDPQAAAISSAYVSLFNQYVRETLDFKPGMPYRPEYYDSVLAHWDYLHAPPGAGSELDQATNVMPDMAMAIEVQPRPEGAAERRVLRPGDAVLRGGLCHAAPGAAAVAGEEHLVPVLRLGPHGLRRPAVAEEAARQRREVHRVDLARELALRQGTGRRPAARPCRRRLAGFPPAIHSALPPDNDLERIASPDDLRVKFGRRRHHQFQIQRQIRVRALADCPFDAFKGIYERAYDLGLNRCTTLRPNPARGAVLAETEQSVNAPTAARLGGKRSEGRRTHQPRWRARPDVAVRRPPASAGLTYVIICSFGVINCFSR